jgi:CheY-like chemotaxis protein
MKKVLIVGGILFRVRIKSILGRAEFHILQAKDNDDALVLHKERKVDLIITKLELDGMSAEDFCDSVRKEPELKMVAIVLICDNTPQNIVRCKTIKANGLITQPFTDTDFDTRINTYLDVPKRQAYRVFTSLKFDDAKNSLPHHCKMVNISSTGILVEAHDEFSMGDKLNFSFFLPSSARISAGGEIVRITPSMSGIYQYGIKFAALDSTMQTELDQFVASHN